MSTATIEQVTVTRLRFEDTEVFLEDLGPNAGKITVSGYNQNYSYYWGSMGGTLAEFLCSINKEYFASKLMGARNDYIMDAKGTFAAIRKHIREEIGLQWYEHKEFQSDMRRIINSFQEQTTEYPSQDLFIERWYRFIEDLDFGLIYDKYDSDRLKKEFNNISEPWHFIKTKLGPDYLWLLRLHGNIKKALTKTLHNEPTT